MRILVAGSFEAASMWAHAVNTVKMAQGFARLGHDVTILCQGPSAGPIAPAELARLYGLTEALRWVQIPSTVLRHRVGEHWGFALLALPSILSSRPNMIFARNYILPWVTSRCGIPTIAESHAHPDNRTAPLLRLVSATRHKDFKTWVTISHHLAEHYRSLGVPEGKLLVLPDAVDLALFQRPQDLPSSPYSDRGPHVLYSGHLYDYKGIPTILQAAARLPAVEFHLLGGWPEDIARQQERANEQGLTNVVFHGLRPHSEVPPFLWHASVLLLPPSQHHPSAAWTSPLKLGEYLASGTPVVATDIPALRDWLTDTEVEFVPPDDPEAMARAIDHLLSNGARTQQLGLAGLGKARDLSYERRAASVLQAAGFKESS
jgi:glycosyltransferase involved in cell wall biosynthesis